MIHRWQRITRSPFAADIRRNLDQAVMAVTAVGVVAAFLIALRSAQTAALALGVAR